MAMGYRGTTPEPDICALVNEVRAEIQSLCTPRYMFQILEARQPSKSHILAGDMEFSPGGIIGSYLSGMTHVCLFVATAGKEYDDYLHRLKKTRQYCEGICSRFCRKCYCRKVCHIAW